MQSYVEQIEQSNDLILKNLNSKNVNLRHEAQAAFNLFSFELLVKALENVDYEVRVNATRNLSKLNDKRAAIHLIKALDDRCEAVCRYAIDGLGRLGDQRAVDPLIEILLTNYRDKRWRRFAPTFLSKLTKSWWLPYITADIHICAASALGNICDERALPALQWAAKNDNGKNIKRYRTVKEAALVAIEQITEKQSHQKISDTSGDVV